MPHSNADILCFAHFLNFLADMPIAVTGDYNNKKQFVVKKYAVIRKTKVMIKFEMAY